MLKISQLWTILACGCLLFIPTVSSGAVVTNGGFESGLTGWGAIGNAVAQGPLTPGTPIINPDAGNSHALVTSGNNQGGDLSVVPGAIENFLNLSAGSLASINAVAFRGSAISQVLTGVNAGDVLTFSWNFVTTETTPSVTNNDFSFFSLSRTGGVSTTTLLANTNSVFTSIANGSFTAQTGYRQSTFEFLTAGDYTLGFGAVNAQDGNFNSGLLIDQVSITAVPEPTSLAAVGLGGLLLSLRRRRNR
jgi:hypothetical protein